MGEVIGLFVIKSSKLVEELDIEFCIMDKLTTGFRVTVSYRECRQSSISTSRAKL